ncbi:Dual specificity testis-specific protein kinase 2 [Portunus trituberculatus]|uniref:Dual specificity testis-specific protein kinase 2 n=1 Tax=Portunus trituberculatus TaxID=210409 RepID=A0A5B7G8A7_PORTR|nr:Dual specificity testis-specific protein kinase 2 [Portunus trituberculatus]
MKRKQLSLPQNEEIPVVTKKQKYSEEVVDDLTRESGVSKRNVLKHAETDSYTKEEKRERRQLKHNGVRVLHERRIREIKRFYCEYLGCGTYGSCCLVQDPKTSKDYVIKTFYEDMLKYLVEEALALKQNQAPGVQRLIGVCIHTRELVTVYAGVTIEEYFSTSISFADAILVVLQTSKTIQVISEAGYSHNDIKRDNVCVDYSRDKKGPVATIIDLGLAARVGTWEIYKNNNCDPEDFPWIAPELLHNTHPCSEASDVYSLALFVQNLLRLPEGRAPATLLVPLMGWVRAARNHDPQERPGLSALIEVQQVLLQEGRRQGASSGQSPSSGDNVSETLPTDETRGSTYWTSSQDGAATTESKDISS